MKISHIMLSVIGHIVHYERRGRGGWVIYRHMLEPSQDFLQDYFQRQHFLRSIACFGEIKQVSRYIYSIGGGGGDGCAFHDKKLI